MPLLSSLGTATALASPIEALGNVLDRLFTSDEERAHAQAVLTKLAQHPAELQIELTRVEAQHRSVFVAGWRPFIGWICGLGLTWTFFGHPLFEWFAALWAPEVKPPAIGAEHLFELVLAMLGLGGLRTVEKLGGRAR